jgi:uncharacterized protein (DUF4415 family)
MSESKQSTVGSDMARVEAHVIGAPEYDELPELTAADLERGVWSVAGQAVSPAVGKTAFSAKLKKQKINLTIDPDVLAWYRSEAGGRGYQTFINATLRQAMQGIQIEQTLRRVIREELHV